MKKNVVLLKRYMAALTLLCSLICILNACKKELNSELSNKESISQLEKWYHNQLHL